MTRLSLASLTRRLSRSFIIPTLALALVLNPLGSGAAVAGSRDRDGNDELNALLAALLGLAVVGAVVSNKNDRREKPYVYEPTRRDPKPRRRVHDDRYAHPKYSLPRKCLRKFNTQFGKERYWAKRCLKRNYDFVKSLPRNCRDTVVARNRDGVYISRKVYRPRCLKRAGYRK